MHRLRRCFLWGFCLACVAAVGFGVFGFVRQRPRWTLNGSFDVLQVSADGSFLVTEGRDEGNEPGVLRLWNTRAEATEREPPFDGRVRERRSSPDGRFLAATLEGGAILIDLDQGRKRTLPDLPPIVSIEFSPQGRWLLARPFGEPRVFGIDLRNPGTAFLTAGVWLSGAAMSYHPRSRCSTLSAAACSGGRRSRTRPHADSRRTVRDTT